MTHLLLGLVLVVLHHTGLVHGAKADFEGKCVRDRTPGTPIFTNTGAHRPSKLDNIECGRGCSAIGKNLAATTQGSICLCGHVDFATATLGECAGLEQPYQVVYERINNPYSSES